jgi:hypothetical protein
MIWVQPLYSRHAHPDSLATHLEVELEPSLMRCLRLARNWFAACPEHLLEIQTFCVNPTLLMGTGSTEVSEPRPRAAGVFAARPAGWREQDQDLTYAFLHVGRSALWFEVCTHRDEVLETAPIQLEDVPTLEYKKPAADECGRVTVVTLALELTIRHDGAFTDAAFEELLNNLDFALEGQRGSGCLAPESLDGVTEDFVFRDLDLRWKETP